MSRPAGCHGWRPVLVPRSGGSYRCRWAKTPVPRSTGTARLPARQDKAIPGTPHAKRCPAHVEQTSAPCGSGKAAPGASCIMASRPAPVLIGCGYRSNAMAAKWAPLPAMTNRCQISWKPKRSGSGLGHLKP